jgi:hypothetical protein
MPHWQSSKPSRRDGKCSVDPMDPNFKRLRYCRYADDFMIGIIGSKAPSSFRSGNAAPRGRFRLPYDHRAL